MADEPTREQIAAAHEASEILFDVRVPDLGTGRGPWFPIPVPALGRWDDAKGRWFVRRRIRTQTGRWTPLAWIARRQTGFDDVSELIHRAILSGSGIPPAYLYQDVDLEPMDPERAEAILAEVNALGARWGKSGAHLPDDEDDVVHGDGFTMRPSQPRERYVPPPLEIGFLDVELPPLHPAQLEALDAPFVRHTMTVKAHPGLALAGLELARDDRPAPRGWRAFLRAVRDRMTGRAT